MTRIVPLRQPASDLHAPKSTPPIQQASPPIPIRLLTHNIRYATNRPFKGEAPWSTRRPYLTSELAFHSTGLPSTFICLQEVLHKQILAIHADLNDSGSHNGEWAYIGVGRDDGKEAGEYEPIFYRPAVWRLLEWQTRWLSETPMTPSKGWDASSTRIVTVGEFEHRETGRKVVVMNTHLDDQGVKSREESAKLILRLIDSVGKAKEPAAVLLSGDFNSHPDGAAYQVMTADESSMEDVCFKIPEKRRYGNEYTFTSFGFVDKKLTRIDFIFSRKGDKLNHCTYAVLSNLFDTGVYSSDHRAVVADLQLLG